MQAAADQGESIRPRPAPRCFGRRCHPVVGVCHGYGGGHAVRS